MQVASYHHQPHHPVDDNDDQDDNEVEDTGGCSLKLLRPSCSFHHHGDFSDDRNDFDNGFGDVYEDSVNNLFHH